MENSFEKFSVLMAVYFGDDSVLFRKALHSVYHNSLQPSQVILVVDGQVDNAIKDVINEFLDYGIEPIWLPENLGLTNALNQGLGYCRHDLIARCDADDINSPNRFKLQIEKFSKEPNLKLLGGQVIEKDEVDNFYKLVPLKYEAIKKFAKTRNPFNHMTVMFRKEAVIGAGSYPSIPLREDYALWVQLLSLNYEAANLPDILVNVSGGRAMYARRGKPSHIAYEIMLQRHFLRCGYISIFYFIRNILVRSLNMLLPSVVRGWIYRVIFRSSTNK